jgi:site-specific recombinase XerD
MAATVPSAPTLVTPGDLGEELGAFTRHLRAGNVSPNTIYAYGGAVVSLGEFLMAHGFPTNVREIRREHVEEWISGLLETYKPTTAHQRFRGAQRFFGWYQSIDDSETFRSPMARLSPPRLPEYMPDVLTIEQLRALLAVTAGRTFEDRRDAALLRIFFDTGARRAEVANLRWSAEEKDINLDTGQVRLFGKGRRERYVQLSPKTREAVDAYRRARAAHPHADEPWLWLGRKGRLTDSGIAQTIRDIGLRAGIPGLHPHTLRHSWRHHAASEGMSREDMMALGGWRSDAMLRRYASSTANARALESAKKIALGDKL